MSGQAATFRRGIPIKKAVGLLASRRTALGMLGVMGLFTLAGAVLPEAAATALYLSGVFRVVVALFVAVLAVSLILRFQQVQSLRMLGSWLMHFSVVLVSIGAVINVVSSKEGFFEAIEGQTVPLPGGGCTLSLLKLSPFTMNGKMWQGESARVRIYSPGERDEVETVYVHRPVKVAGMQVRLVKHGFAPHLAFSGGKDGEKAGAYVSLNTEFGRQVRYWLELGPPNFPESFSVVFHPAEAGPFLRSPSMNMVFQSDRQTAVLRPGKSISHGGYTYAMGNVRYWAQFRVSKDPGLGLVFTGFWVAVAGASAALLPRVFHADA